MTDKIDRLKKLDNNKLIDVVRNFRQYGYDDEFRENAVQILEDRGISKEQLQLTGSFDNKTYDFANELFNTFKKNSKKAFVTYIVLFIVRVTMPLLSNESQGLILGLLIVSIIAFILYFIFLIMSFMNQSQFYKEVGHDYGADGALLYLFLGMPFYMFMYFYFSNQMKEKMESIH